MTTVPVLPGLPAGRLLPVLTLESPAGAGDLAEAMAAGGVHIVEVTLRTAAGLPAITAMAGRADLVVGAGTVVDPDGVDRAVDAGAAFIVCPGFDPEVVERARARDVAVLPGVATASEVQRAVRAGLAACKFFPAELLGGPAMLRALGAPFRAMRFVPSGGVSAANAGTYLAEPNVPMVSGSWMLPTAALAAHDWSTVQRLCLEAVALLGADA